MSSPRTVELASSILSNVHRLEDFLKTANLPSPSFAPGTPPTLPLQPDVQASVDAAIAAMDELMSLLLGPVGLLTKQMGLALDPCSLHAVYKYKIASRIPVDSSVAIADLAEQVSVDPDSLDRLLQYAVGNYLFEQPEPGRISHTALSLMLANPQVNDFIGMHTEDVWPAAPMLVPALATGKTGHQLANSSGLPFFDTLANDPARASRFASAMACIEAIKPGKNHSTVLDAYDWVEATKTSHTVVDVGGSHGEFARAVAKKHPGLRVVLQDLPGVIEAAAKKKAEAPHEWANVELQAHDFFRPQPLHGADVYHFRMILHDWSDDKCIEILRQLKPAMRPGARILINEHLMPPPGVLSRFHERQMRYLDLTMMALIGGKERSQAEWKMLLAKADPGFRLASVTRLPPSPMALIEVVWEP